MIFFFEHLPDKGSIVGMVKDCLHHIKQNGLTDHWCKSLVDSALPAFGRFFYGIIQCLKDE